MILIKTPEFPGLQRSTSSPRLTPHRLVNTFYSPSDDKEETQGEGRKKRRGGTEYEWRKREGKEKKERGGVKQGRRRRKERADKRGNRGGEERRA